MNHREYIEKLEAENLDLRVKLKIIQDKVNSQAEDEGLWFIARTAQEEYLQQGLRELHRVIEREPLK